MLIKKIQSHKINFNNKVLNKIESKSCKFNVKDKIIIFNKLKTVKNQ